MLMLPPSYPLVVIFMAELMEVDALMNTVPPLPSPYPPPGPPVLLIIPRKSIVPDDVNATLPPPPQALSVDPPEAFAKPVPEILLAISQIEPPAPPSSRLS